MTQSSSTLDLAIIEHTELLRPRFWAKVIKGTKDDCWLWQAQRDVLGYGRIKIIGGRPALAHRVSYALENGSIHGVVCHTCDNPSCVNPNHLFCGTQMENVRDMDTKRRRKCNIPRRVLCASDAQVIRDSKDPSGILAARFGVSKRTIRDVRRFKTWKHLPPSSHTQKEI